MLRLAKMYVVYCLTNAAAFISVSLDVHLKSQRTIQQTLFEVNDVNQRVSTVNIALLVVDALCT